MINQIIDRFQAFRNRLFQFFQYRADATMDLIDAVAGENAANSIVKISLSQLFRRTYSSITDVLDNLFRLRPDNAPSFETFQEQALKVTQILAAGCAPPTTENFSLFALDCTANPRLHANKTSDRMIVHSPTHVPGQKPITVGHMYSVLVHLPDDPVDKALHWVVPLSVRRVRSSESGSNVGLMQLREIATQTIFQDHFCVSVADTAYSNRQWLVEVDSLPHVVHIARMRNNRKVYRMPPAGCQRKRGRPSAYGDEVLLSSPPQADSEEITVVTTPRGQYSLRLDRWNDVLARGAPEHPFDLVRVTTIDANGQPLYARPLWLMLAGKRRKEITAKQAANSYRRRYDIEHYFRFGKQKLHLIDSQTSETRHEESWQWIALLGYTMLYHGSCLAKAISYPWEKRKVCVILSKQRPTQVQRDYARIIRGIGTPACIPKPRGKSPGRQCGMTGTRKPVQPIVRKRRQRTKSSRKTGQYTRMRRIKVPESKQVPMRC